ncbi:hypothetical protein M378DRAFT_959619 [Amanita muscaria Koide BX008]|uniref:Uncharacterized protein n=1 Tax=Amanita muscaria (strain Koide BX008) TaxID=946122 RepID=A0A0C2SAZ2_AMAMK|nr:hypothetical protein M378DRAFT_959619 [Amanita muscaria Koide BX008]
MTPFKSRYCQGRPLQVMSGLNASYCILRFSACRSTTSYPVEMLSIYWIYSLSGPLPPNSYPLIWITNIDRYFLFSITNTSITHMLYFRTYLWRPGPTCHLLPPLCRNRTLLYIFISLKHVKQKRIFVCNTDRVT